MDVINTTDTLPHTRLKKLATSRQLIWRTISSWLLAWEIYPILLIATFLRFYQIGTTEFDADQAFIFGMARNAVTHGLIPVTTNIASIGIANPPATIYLLMSGALFSANPMAGVIMTAIMNVLAVILTYAVVRRYYGRVAGTTASLLYAVGELTVFFSRFMWNQNLLAPFVPLFLFALFWGVVERRRGWLAPAILLWGWMIQLHGSAILLAIPLLLSCVLAFRTLRWRDVLLAAGLLLLIYSPYIVWEMRTHFSDIPILLSSLHQKARFDSQSVRDYIQFLDPNATMAQEFNMVFQYNPASWQPRLAIVFRLIHWITLALTLGGMALALGAVALNKWQVLTFVPRGAALPTNASFPATFWGRLRAWYIKLMATPWRCGLLVILVWQILPVLILVHHSLPVYNYYLLILMPGPFILIGILVAQIHLWLRAQSIRLSWKVARYALALLLAGLIGVQSIGTLALIVDEAQGNHNHVTTYNTLQDMQNALSQADQLAQSYHLHHVYINTDSYTQDALTYLTEQMQTPYTVSTAGNCLLLPGSAQGSAVVMIGPLDTLSATLLDHSPYARLVSKPVRLGSTQPYRLYIVQPTPQAGQNAASFLNDLQLQGTTFSQLPGTSTQTIVTSWNVLSAAPAVYGKVYHYTLQAKYIEKGQSIQGSHATCDFSNLKPGEELLTAFPLSGNSASTPNSLVLNGSRWTTSPFSPSYGPFHLETLQQQNDPSVPLQANTGGNTLLVQKPTLP